MIYRSFQTVLHNDARTKYAITTGEKAVKFYHGTLRNAVIGQYSMDFSWGEDIFHGVRVVMLSW